MLHRDIESGYTCIQQPTPQGLAIAVAFRCRVLQSATEETIRSFQRQRVCPTLTGRLCVYKETTTPMQIIQASQVGTFSYLTILINLCRSLQFKFGQHLLTYRYTARINSPQLARKTNRSENTPHLRHHGSYVRQHGPRPACYAS